MARLFYSVGTSPLGEIVLAATDAGVCVLDWGGERGALPMLEWRTGVRAERDEDALARLRADLERYFSGAGTHFSVPVDLACCSDFDRRVLHALAEIPFGEVTSYGSLAKRVGTSPRAVGGALGRNPVPILLPCHRVVAGDGSLGGFSGGLERKRFLLSLEGSYR